MSTAGLVLVHGGARAGDCWEPTVSALAERSPETPVLAVDLPGRRAVPGDLGRLTIDECVESVVAQIDAAGLDEVVLVGHSMAGLTLPGVAAALGATRAGRLVFLSCCVPPEGGAVLDTLSGVLRVTAGRSVRRGGRPAAIPKLYARWFFCNGMTREQRRFSLSRLYPESPGIVGQVVSRRDLPVEIPRTWILLTKDRSLTPAKQRTFIENLGGVEEVVELATCNNAMISEPESVAALLLARAS